jgi:hypothetical protein
MPSPLSASLLVAAALLASAGGARADLIAGCAPEISRYCSGVTEGRGRISACLASHSGGLGPTCRPEVQALSRSPLTPAYVRRALDPNFRAPLPASCDAPAAKFCPGMTPGEGRVFACLYAFSDRVAQVCTDAAQAALRAAN